MKVNDLLSQPGEWLKGTGPEGDVVISSRVRLARNLRRFPFLPVASATVRSEIEKFVRSRLQNTKLPRSLAYWSLGDLTAVERSLLVERHLISREHAQGRQLLILYEIRNLLGASEYSANWCVCSVSH